MEDTTNLYYWSYGSGPAECKGTPYIYITEINGACSSPSKKKVQLCSTMMRIPLKGDLGQHDHSICPIVLCPAPMVLFFYAYLCSLSPMP